MGSCNTTYSWGAAERGRMMVIKQRTAGECANFPRLGYNSFGASTCTGKPQDEMTATTQAYYQLSRGATPSTLKAHIISSFGYQALQWHPPTGALMYNLAK